MPRATDIPDALVALELERIAASAAFRRSPRQVRLLRYLVLQACSGAAGRLKESSIAVDVFERAASSFDGRVDTAIRVEMGRLRKRLARYYVTDGASAPLQIDLPVGSYVPVLHRRARTARLPSIAVLPFIDLTDGAASTSFAAALTEQITDALAQVPGVKVVARTSAARYEGVRMDVRAIGRALGVATLLESSVQASGGQLKVVAQWVRANDGYHAWSRSIESQSGEAPHAFQERVARDVVSGLQRRLLEETASELPLAMPFLRRAANAAAQDAYDRARYLLRLDSIDGYVRALPFLRECVTLDPRFALGHCGVARALLNVIGMTAAPSAALIDDARASVAEALELDAGLGEAHAVQGFIRFAFDHDWAAAERAHLRGIHLAPSLPYAHSAYAWGLMFNGRFAEADAEFAFARELDPLDLKVRTHQALNALYAGDAAHAIRELDGILDVEPRHSVARALRGTARLWSGEPEAATADFAVLLEVHPGLTIGEVGLAEADAMSGHVRRARSRLVRLQKEAGARHLPSYQVAMIHARLGETDAALEWLDRAARELDMNFVCAPLDRAFADLRGDPRFGALLARHGLRAGLAAGPAR